MSDSLVNTRIAVYGIEGEWSSFYAKKIQVTIFLGNLSSRIIEELRV
jgi:hypothetical protein